MNEPKLELSCNFLLEENMQDILWVFGPECVLACLWAKALLIRREDELDKRDILRIANNCRIDERFVELALDECEFFEHENGIYWLKEENKQDGDSLKAMPYNEFLKTGYWKRVAYAIKSEAGFKCAQCGSMKRLEVHHLSYEHKGDEMNHPEDLICLCHECHSKLHDKK